MHIQTQILFYVYLPRNIQIKLQIFLKIINNFIMTNLLNYSPHNKSFKFIHFQNQAYHEANKIYAKPCVRTNIRYKKVAIDNPEFGNLSFFNNLSNGSISKRQRSNKSFDKADLSASYISMKSMVSQEKRVVHKNASYQKFQKYRIIKENKEMVDRLINTSCQVIKNSKSKQSFNKHLKYKEIRRVYNNKNVRKQQLVIPYQKLLCPTLSSFRNSICDLSSSYLSSSNVNQNQLLLKRPATTRSSASKRKSQNNN